MTANVGRLSAAGNRMLQAVRSEGGLMVLCFKSLFDEADARKSVG